MRYRLMIASAAVAASPAYAADELKFAPVPEWVVQRSIPADAAKRGEAPVLVLLNDLQVRLEPGKATSFTDLALKVQTPDGLAAGNITFAWQPATDTVTVNKLHIVRDGKAIDVLKSGQTFTVARRETNMEAAVLDGTLTANIQPEGLQVGDIINLAVTNERVDPVMNGHVEAVYGAWDGAIIENAHSRIIWPSKLRLFTQQTAELPRPRRSSKDGWNVLELSADNVEPLLLPKGAPVRFQVGRAGEATDFESWSDVAELMLPLYREAAVVPRAGPLRDEVEKIRQSAKSDKERTEKALQLVEERVRYVALTMGTGGYVPASAELTWSRRFGDCKAKTALLVAILRELGVKAEPVAVHSKIGDALPERLPMVSYFDHVIVRAEVAGKTYWLDGTRSGDVDLDRIPVPGFKWGLPLTAGAKLVPLIPQPLSEPSIETVIEIDASTGVFATVPFKVERTFRGDDARVIHAQYSALSPAQLDRALREYWRNRYDDVEVESVNSAFDKSRAELRWSMAGKATLDWSDNNWLYVPDSTIAFEPDLDRADGPYRDAPFAISYPDWEKTHVTIRLPEGFAAGPQKMPLSIKETLAGVEYMRDVQLNGSTFTVKTGEKALVAEIPYKNAIASKARLKALYDEDVHLRVPNGYRLTEADFAGLAAREPASASELVWRGNIYLDGARFDEAIADFTEAHRLDPANRWALANRAMARVWKREWGEAAKDLAAAERIDPGNYVVLRARGLMAEFKGDYGAAVELFTKALSGDPGNTFALSHRAFAYSNLEKFAEAIADLNAVLAQQPRNAQALAQRAYVYRAMGRTDDAFADSEAALGSGAIPPDLRLLRANMFRDQGKRELVLKEAELLIEENPKSDYALVAAGKIFSAEGRRDRAMQAIERALALKREAYIYINRSQVRAPDDYAGRLADLEEALKLEPGHPNALAIKASLLMRQKRYADALQVYEAALRGEPDDPLDIRRAIAIALYKGGRTTEAEKAFADIRSQTKTATDFNNLCWDKATAGILLESALTDCREALRSDPGSGNNLDSLGFVLLRLGRLEESIAAYDQALAQRNDATSLMGRAIARARKGDMARAEADRAEALKLNPDIEARYEGFGLTFAEDQNSLVAK